jgi:hypothetical protein
MTRKKWIIAVAVLAVLVIVAAVAYKRKWNFELLPSTDNFVIARRNGLITIVQVDTASRLTKPNDLSFKRFDQQKQEIVFEDNRDDKQFTVDYVSKTIKS